MNIFDSYLFLSILTLFFINGLGYLYSYLIVTEKIGINKKIQFEAERGKEYFLKHTPLFLINVSLLILFVFIGFYFF